MTARASKPEGSQTRSNVGFVVSIVVLVSITIIVYASGIFNPEYNPAWYDGFRIALSSVDVLLAGAILVLTWALYGTRKGYAIPLIAGAMALGGFVEFVSLHLLGDYHEVVGPISRTLEFGTVLAVPFWALTRRSHSSRTVAKRIFTGIAAFWAVLLVLLYVLESRGVALPLYFPAGVVPRPLNLLPLAVLSLAAFWSIPRIQSVHNERFYDGLWCACIPLFFALLQSLLESNPSGTISIEAIASTAIARLAVLWAIVLDIGSVAATRNQAALDTCRFGRQLSRLEADLKRSAIELEQLESETQAAQEEMAMYRTMVDDSDELYLLARLTGEVNYVNSAGLRMLGGDSDKKNLADLVLNRERIDEAIRTTAQGNAWFGRLELATTTGPNAMDCSITAVQAQSVFGNRLIVLHGRDIKKNQELLRQNRRLRWLSTVAPACVIELATDGSILYANPETQRRFPDADETKFRHPLLQGVGSIVDQLEAQSLKQKQREILIGEVYYRQHISYEPTENRLVVYSREITEEKQKLLNNDLLVHRMLWLYELDKGKNQKPYELITKALIESCSWFELSHVTLSREDETGFKYVYTYPEGQHNPGAPDMMPDNLREALRQRNYAPFEIAGDGSETVRPILGIRIQVNAQPWGALYYSGTQIRAFDQYKHQLLEILARWLGARLEWLQNRNDYEHFFNVSNLMMCTCHPNGRLKTVNAALAEKLGRTPDELQNLDLWSLPHEDDRSVLQDAWQQLSDSNTINELKFRLKTAGEQLRKVELTAVAYGAIQTVYCTILDRKPRSTRSNTGMDSELLTRMTHELRTPLNGFVGMVELLESTKLDARQDHYLAQMKNSSEVMLHLLEMILDYAKLESQNLELRKTPIDLQEIAEHALGVVESDAMKKGITLMMRYHPAAPRNLIGDSLRLQEIIGNLLSNAVRFTEIGHVLLEVQAQKVDTDSCRACIRVEDSGVGIAPEQLDEIFTPFRRITGKPGGTGIGLTIARQLARMMGGDITVESQYGEGSTFSLDLVLPVCHETDRSRTTAKELNIKKALLLMGNPVALQIMAEALDDVSLVCHTHTSTVNTLKAIDDANDSETPYRLIVVDDQISNPDIAGFADIIASQNANQSTKLVACLIERHKGEPLKPNPRFDAVITPPITPGRVIDTLTQVFVPALLEERHLQSRTDTLRFEPPIDVLVAEDNPVHQDVLIGFLNEVNANITLVEDGKKAVEAVCGGRYSIIFMDCILPIIDGFEAVQSIRRIEKGRRTPIIAMASDSKQLDKRKCEKATMDSYIEKPIRKKNLYRLLREYLITGREPGQFHEPSTTQSIALPQQIENAARGIGVKRDLYLRILSMFASSLDEHFGIIKQTLERKQSEELKSAAHKLGASSANLKIAELKNICLQIEELAKSEDWQGLEAAVVRLETDIEQVKKLSTDLSKGRGTRT